MDRLKSYSNAFLSSKYTNSTVPTRADQSRGRSAAVTAEMTRLLTET